MAKSPKPAKARKVPKARKAPKSPKSAALPPAFVPKSLAEPAGRYGDNSFAQYLGIEPADTPHIINEIREGLPFDSYAAFLKEIDLSQKYLSEIVRIPASTLARRQEAGSLTPEESDRVARIAKVFADAVALFEGDKLAARNWLTAPSKALEDETPLNYSRSELGAREVEKLIGRLEHGVFS